MAANFKISGSLGIGGAGATVNYTGNSSGSVTADASGDYTISVPINGTYTITPALSGSIFHPASRIIVVSGSDVAGVDFGLPWSSTDSRNFGIFPNSAVNIQGTLTYTVPSVDSRVNIPIDSRASVPQNCRVAPNIPQNSRTPGTFGPGE